LACPPILINGIFRVGRFASQFMLMNENSRCSILFHVLVPGGKWQTEISIPSSFASCCSSTFHSLILGPLLPPASAGMRSRG
jgi:hypothetical protein